MTLHFLNGPKKGDTMQFDGRPLPEMRFPLWLPLAGMIAAGREGTPTPDNVMCPMVRYELAWRDEESACYKTDEYVTHEGGG